MNGWAPKCIRVRCMPILPRGKNRSAFPADSRLAPFSLVPFQKFSDRIISVLPLHSCYGYSLIRFRAHISTDKQVKKLLALIEHGREITISSREVIVARAAHES